MKGITALEILYGLAWLYVQIARLGMALCASLHGFGGLHGLAWLMRGLHGLAWHMRGLHDLAWCLSGVCMPWHGL